MQETQEMRVQSLGWKDTLEEETATHSSILAWKIPWAEEPGRPQVCGITRSWMSLSTHAGTIIFTYGVDSPHTKVRQKIKKQKKDQECWAEKRQEKKQEADRRFQSAIFYFIYLWLQKYLIMWFIAHKPHYHYLVAALSIVDMILKYLNNLGYVTRTNLSNFSDRNILGGLEIQFEDTSENQEYNFKTSWDFKIIPTSFLFETSKIFQFDFIPFSCFQEDRIPQEPFFVQCLSLKKTREVTP